MSPTPAKLNPFPGLRPFTQEEDYLFFGREEQTLELLQRLGSNRFVAVVGTSGSGKSSLVRCGLLSELLGGRMLVAGASWEIAVTHPGGNPLAILTDALLNADLYDREVENVRENLLATLSRSHFGLVEAVKQAGLPQDTNFLLVVDQFEEIFRFQDAGQRQQEVANEFVSLLLEAVAQKDVPIYVVLTMRSDFIGECGQFEGLAELVNRAEFLIPRLNREQYKRVIEGPIKVAGGQISPRLLQRLLNDLGQQADQLPCLQHALMRTWDVWAAKGDSEALDLDDYQRVGRMSQALSLHADEIYESLDSDRQRLLAEGIFQALTVEESNNRGIRRPQRLGRLCQILEVPPDELIPIIDAYRQSGVTFLMPSPDVELTEQTIIDISHESLMRVWVRLRQWVEEETQAAGIYHRLSESADLHAQGRAGLYRDPELGIALAWKTAKRPNTAWAERYRPGFDIAMAFLDASRQATVAEERAQEAARQHELEHVRALAESQRARAEIEIRAARRAQRLLVGAAIIAVFAVSASLIAVRFWRDADLAKQAAQQSELAAQESALAAKREADKASAQGLVAKQARLEAEENLARARGAIDDYLIKISESQLLATPGMQPLRADLLASASQFYEDILKKDPDNPDLQAGLAAAFYRVGLVKYDTGDLDQSAQLAEQATQSYTSAVQLQPNNPELRHGLAKSWFLQASIKYQEASPVKALEYAKRAVQIWETLIQEGHQELQFQKELARAYNMLGIAYSNISNDEASFLSYQRSLSIRLSLIPDHPDDAQLIHGLAESFGNISTDIADPELRLQMALRCIGYAERAHRLRPQNVEYASDLAGFYGSAAQVLAANGRDAEALDIFRRELDHIGKFVRGNPSVLSARRLIRNSIIFIARTGARRADPAPYIQLFCDALALSSALPKESAEDYIIDAQTQSAGSSMWPTVIKQSNLDAFTAAQASERKSMRDRSLDSLRQAVALGFKDALRLKNDLQLGEVRSELGFNQLVAELEASASPEAAVAKENAQAKLSQDELVQQQDDLAISYQSFGVMETQYRRNAQARKSLEQALALRQTLADADPSNAQRQSELIAARASLAQLLWNEGQLATALKQFNVRTESLEEALRQAPEDIALQASLASHLRAVADSFAGVALWEQAVPHYIKAMELERVLPNPTVEARHAEILAPAMDLLRGADDAYRLGCEQVLERFGTNGLGEDALRIARLYALRPIAQDRIDQIVALAEKATYHWHAYTQALVYYRAGRFEDAIQTIEKAEKAKTYHGIQQDQFVLAMAYFQLGQRDRARQVLDAVNRLTLAAMDQGWHTHGTLLDVDWIVLRREANELIYGGPYSGDDLQRRGRAFAQLGELDKSVAELAAVTERSPDYPRGHFAYARALAQVGRKEQAEQILHKARQLFDEQESKVTFGDGDCWQLGGETLSLLGQKKDASQWFQNEFAVRFIDIFDRSPLETDRQLLFDAQNRLADALQAAGRIQEATQIRGEFEVLLKLLRFPPLIVNANEFLRSQPGDTAAPQALIAVLDQILARSHQTFSADTPIRWHLLARLHQRRVELLREAGRQTEIAADLSAAQSNYERALHSRPADSKIALHLSSLLVESDAAIKWTPLKPTSITSEGGATLTLQSDGSILASGVNPIKDVYTLTADAGPEAIAAIRLEAVPDPALPFGSSGRASGNGNFALGEWTVQLQPRNPGEEPTPIKWKNAFSDHQLEAAEHYDKRPMHIGLAIDGDPRTYWECWPQYQLPHWAVFVPEQPVRSDSSQKLEVLLEFKTGALHHNLGRFRVLVTSDVKAIAQDALRIQIAKFTDPWQKLAAAYYLQGNRPALDQLLKQHPATVACLGQIQALEQNWAGAVTEYNKVITPDTTDPHLLANRGAAYEKLKQFDLAVADFTRAAKFDPDAPFWRLRSAEAKLTQKSWRLSVQNGGAGSIEVVDGALEIKSTAATGTDWTVQAFQEGLEFEDGSQYVIRFKMKTPDALLVGIMAQVSGGDWREIGLNKTFVPPPEFRDYELTFVPRKSLPGNNRIVLNFGRRTGSATIKDFVIYKHFNAQEFDRALQAAEGHKLQSDQAVAAYARVLKVTLESSATARIIDSVAERIVRLEKLADAPPPDGPKRAELVALVTQLDGLIDNALQRYPDDSKLHLAVARKLSERGQRLQSVQRPAEALALLQKSSDILSGLRSRSATQWTVLTPTSMRTTSGATLTARNDQSILLTGNLSVKDTYTIDFGQIPHDVRTIRLEALSDPSLPGGGPGTHHPGNFVLSDLSLLHADRDESSEFKPVNLKFASATFEERPVHQSLEKGESGWSIDGGTGRPQTAFFGVAADEAIPSSDRLRLVLDFYHEPGDRRPAILGLFRVSVNSSQFDVSTAHPESVFDEGNFVDVTVSLAKALAQQGDSDKATALLATALELTKDHALMGEIIGAVARLNRVLEKLTAQAADNPYFQSALADYLADQGNAAAADASRANARKLFEELLIRQPAESAAASELAGLLVPAQFAPHKIIAPTSELKPESWRYTTISPADNWKNNSFDDSRWATGSAPFGKATKWATRNIWIRRTFEWTADTHQTSLILRLLHDDGCEVFVNGREIYKAADWKPNYDSVVLDPLPHDLLQPGTNTLAVHCHNSHGDQIIDVGLSASVLDKGALADRVANPDLYSPWSKLAMAYHLVDDQAGLNRVLNNHPSATLMLARKYPTERVWQLCLASLNRVITPQTNDHVLFAARAEIHEKLAQWDQAVADWRSVDQHAPDKRTAYGANSKPAMEQCSLIHERLGQYDQFVEDFTQLLKPERWGAFHWAYSRRANGYARLGQFEKALADDDLAVKLCPENERINYQFTRVDHFGYVNAWKLAADSLRPFYTQSSDVNVNWWEHRTAALIFAMANDPEYYRNAALQCLRKSAPDDLGPGNAKWLVLTMLQMPGTINPENQAELLRRAEREDDFWRPRLTAAIHFRNGDYQQAADIFDAIEPGDPFWFLAAMNYHRLGKVERARELLNRGSMRVTQQLATAQGRGIPRGYGYWQDWTIEVASQREAKQLILGETSDDPLLLARLGQSTEAAIQYAKQLASATDEAEKARLLNEVAQFNGMTTAVYVLNRDWKNAAAADLKRVEASNDSVTWMLPAVLSAYGEGSAGHRLMCQKMYERFQQSTVAEDIERYLKVMVLLPDGPDLPPESVKQFYAACETVSDVHRPWFYSTRALLEHRAGNLAEAHRWADRVLDEDKGNSDVRLAALAVKALIYARQKDTANARKSLDELKQVMKENLNLTWNADGRLDTCWILNGTSVNHDKLIPDILRREAEQLIKATN